MSDQTLQQHADDAALFAAEQEIAILRGRTRALRAAGDRSDRSHMPINERVFDIEDQIAATPASTLAGAAVKLRRLADPELGLANGLGTGDHVSVQNISALVDGLLGKTDVAEFLAAEREMAEADRLAIPVDSADGDCDEKLKPIYERYDAAVNFIDGTAPQSLPAVIVKLKRLLDAHLRAGDDPERGSLRQCLAFLERQIGGTVEIGFDER